VLRAPSKGVRRELVVALRAKGGQLRVSPFLSAQERDNKGVAYAFARTHDLAVADQGDILALQPKGSVSWVTAMTVALSATKGELDLVLGRVARSMGQVPGRTDAVERGHAARDPAQPFLGRGQWREGPPRRLWERPPTAGPQGAVPAPPTPPPPAAPGRWESRWEQWDRRRSPPMQDRWDVPDLARRGAGPRVIMEWDPATQRWWRAI